VCDFADTELPIGEGIIIMNPEYGSRLGELERLEKVYKRIGDFLKQRCVGRTAYLLIGDRELSVKIGLKASRRIVFYNGNIECRLLKYELYKGNNPKSDY
jgi:putative N6-adenine-specific DNA methylase